MLTTGTPRPHLCFVFVEKTTYGACNAKLTEQYGVIAEKL
jgi:hypothetical protein